MSSSLPKLYYFAGKGSTEVVRVLFHVAGVEFENVQYTVEFTPTGIKNDERFETGKKTGFLAANMDRVPILQVNGVVIGQSKAIERYISRRYGLYGSSVEEEALIDAVVENVRDIKDKWSKIRFSPDGPEKEAAIAKWFGEELKEWLEKLERSLPTNASGVFVVGNKVSYADVSVWNLLRDFFSEPAAAKAEQEAGVTRLTAIANRVSENENLRKYLSTRPVYYF